MDTQTGRLGDANAVGVVLQELVDLGPQFCNTGPRDVANIVRTVTSLKTPKKGGKDWSKNTQGGHLYWAQSGHFNWALTSDANFA